MMQKQFSERRGMGIFHTITGRDFEVTISVTSCRELLPDLVFYIECLEASFAELEAAAAAVVSATPTQPGVRRAVPRKSK